VKKEKQWKRITNKFHKATMEEVDDEDNDTQGETLSEDEGILEEIVETYFIRKVNDDDDHIQGGTIEDDGEQLMEDTSDSEDMILLGLTNKIPAKKVQGKWYINKTEKPASWGNFNLNPQAKDGKPKTLEEMVLEQFHKYRKVFEKKASECMP
jgi:hypothetical protein